MKGVVTGAAGFIGTHLCRRLGDAGWDLCALARDEAEGVEALGDLASVSDEALRDRLAGADVVFHLAGRAHRDDGGRDAGLAAAYRRDNVLATERLYRASCAVGVGRFVQLSTIKVLGDTSVRPLAADAPYAPPDVYSMSKAEAECALRRASETGVPVTILRTPLVYGPGVTGNFARLVHLVERGWPLPLGDARAERSLVCVHNLCDLLTRVSADEARFRVLHVRDVDVCVAELIDVIGSALGCRTRCIAVPRSVLRFALLSTGNGAAYSRLFESLLVDDAATRCLFDWEPRVALRDGVEATVAVRARS